MQRISQAVRPARLRLVGNTCRARATVAKINVTLLWEVKRGRMIEKPFTIANAHIFDPVGQCIYCSGDGFGSPLEDEHIIPFSLGGDLVLPRASCRTCSGITSRIEGYIGRSLFWEFRSNQKLRTRRKKDRPKSLPAKVVLRGGETEIRDFPIDKHPSTIVMPGFPIPGIVRGGSPDEVWGSIPIFSWTLHANVPADSQAVRIRPNVNTHTFARFLAKIAHSYTVATCGINAFRPLLTDIIKGDSHNCAHVIGCDPTSLTLPGAHTHSLLSYVLRLSGVDYFVCKMRLFGRIGLDVPGSYGTPIYSVVVGIIDDPAVLKKILENQPQVTDRPD